MAPQHEHTAVEHENRELLGHPRGIYLIFSTEAWERFSYFGMRGLLILFLTAATADHGFGWSTADALRLYATYTALVYFLPVFGGYIGDAYLGRRRAVMTGAILMMVGHFMMALPGLVAPLVALQSGLPIEPLLFDSGVTLGLLQVPEQAYQAWVSHSASLGLSAPPFAQLQFTYLALSWSFYGSLVFILLGTGFFKSNMATMVGELYRPGDQRRDAGYTIYYAGANLGAFAANLVAGTVGEVWGWHWGFSVAGLGMAVGLLAFCWFAPRLLRGVGDYKTTLRVNRVPLSSLECSRVIAILLMSLFTIIFWMGYEQSGGLLNIMVRDSVDRKLLGQDLPVTWFQSLNPLFIFLFAPLFVFVWGWFEQRRLSPHPTQKYAFGLMLMCVSFALLLKAQKEIDATGQCSAWWLVTVFAVQTIGELAISPVSKALVSRYAPDRIAAPMMGAEFSCYAAGAWFAGILGAWAVSGSAEEAFRFLMIMSAAAALFCLLLKPLIDHLLCSAKMQGSQSDVVQM